MREQCNVNINYACSLLWRGGVPRPIPRILVAVVNCGVKVMIGRQLNDFPFQCFVMEGICLLRRQDDSHFAIETQSLDSFTAIYS